MSFLNEAICWVCQRALWADYPGLGSPGVIEIEVDKMTQMRFIEHENNFYRKDLL